MCIRDSILILSGGLGPTEDDITKEVCAAVMDCSLVEDPHTKKRLEERFKNSIKKDVPESNWKQALVPVGATILDNQNGTAPGLIIEKNGKTVILLPGPPDELCPMFTGQVMPYLQKLQPEVIRSRMVKICGYGESKVEEMAVSYTHLPDGAQLRRHVADAVDDPVFPVHENDIAVLAHHLHDEPFAAQIAHLVQVLDLQVDDALQTRLGDRKDAPAADVLS